MTVTQIPIDVKYIVAKFTENNINKFVYLVPGTAETLELNVYNVSITDLQVLITVSCSIPLGGIKVVYRHKNAVLKMVETGVVIPADTKFDIAFDKYNKNMPFVRLIMYSAPITWEEATYTWNESEGNWNEQIKIILE